MKLQMSISDLSELVSRVSMASGGVAGDLANFLLFRPQGAGFEVLAHSSHTFASVQTDLGSVGGDSSPLMIESSRLLKFLGAAESGSVTIWGDERGVKVQKGTDKPIALPSTAASKWPYLDSQLQSAQLGATIKAGDLACCLEHTRQFASADTKNAAHNLTESRNGYLVSTNVVTAAMASNPDLASVNVRILKADIGAVISWCSKLPDDHPIEILEGEQFAVFRHPKGYLGVNRPLQGFPSKFLTPQITAEGVALIPRDRILKALKLLASGAPTGDAEREVKVSAQGKILTLSMTGASGEENTQEVELPQEVGEGFPEFRLFDLQFQKVLEAQRGDNVLSMGYLRRGASSGMVLFREQIGSSELLTAQAWVMS